MKPGLIPADIMHRLRADFSNPNQADQVEAKVADFCANRIGLNVGSHQYVRAILTLAKGNYAEFVRLAGVPDDPRDIIMAAEAQLGNPEHYFIPPFDQE